MRSFQNTLAIAAGLAILWVVGTWMNPRPGAAQAAPTGSAPVTITGPLPVPVIGSSTVSGTVAATQSGPWNVGLLGGTTVGLTPGTTVGLASGATVSVHNLDEPGRAPYQEFAFASGSQLTCGSGVCSLGVPFSVVGDRQRLVIKEVSVDAFVPSGWSAFGAGVIPCCNNFVHPTALPMSLQMVSAPLPLAEWVTNQQTNLYVDAGFGPQVVLNFNNGSTGPNGGTTFNVTLTGYYVSLP